MDHQHGIFIRDGVVCPERWFSQTVRPLFLLKEAYHGDGDWDLIADHLLTEGKIGRHTTWKRISQWTRGLMLTTEDCLYPYADEAADHVSKSLSASGRRGQRQEKVVGRKSRIIRKFSGMRNMTAGSFAVRLN